MSEQIGIVTWINGPVVRARGSRHVSMMIWSRWGMISL